MIEDGMLAHERKELGFSTAPLELGPEDPEPESAGERE
jgi:hypothetical protein